MAMEEKGATSSTWFMYVTYLCGSLSPVSRGEIGRAESQPSAATTLSTNWQKLARGWRPGRRRQYSGTGTAGSRGGVSGRRDARQEWPLTNPSLLPHGAAVRLLDSGLG